jgi:uncharacterized protein (TIGR03435 family)
MRKLIQIATLAPAFLFAAYGQSSGKAEFEVASIKINPSESGFHFAADAVSGGPGTPDPGVFRCTKCSLATLIVKAFDLQPYQFPGRAAHTGDTYDVMAAIPAGATREEFAAMMQNLLKDRFGLVWHFEEKKMKGYRLVAAKDGPKLKPSTGEALPQAAGQHGYGQGESHNHSGAIVFGSSASYRGANKTIADLIHVLSDQLGVPVDDETGLTGKYDISLRWSGAVAANAANHTDGAFSGGRAGHDGGGAPSAAAGAAPGPTLFQALQEQLGLRLAPADQAVARLLVVDRAARRPTEN